MLLVDDDPLVRSALRVVLGGLDDVSVVGEAADGDEAVALAAATAPDVVLLDVRMPRRDGLSAARELSAGGSGPRVVVLTTFGEDDAVLAALRAGADGFLLKDTPPAGILAAVRRAAAGEPVLSPDATRRLIGHVTGRAAGSPGGADGSAPPPGADARRRQALARLARLGAKEHEVAVAVGRGLPNAEIGARMSLSTATVKAYVSRVMSRLGVDNRVQVAIVVHDAGLL
ncbi:response regulator [Kineococcus sp. T90]|nr:response regulator [Kineococcus indalonis]